MAFEKKLMARSTTSFSDGQTAVYWTYGPSTTDDIATITASGYFDEWIDQVNKDDYLYLVGTDGQDIRAFTSTLGTTPATVAAFITAGDLADGSVTTAKIAALAVTTAKIAALAVTDAKLNTDAVTTVKILDGAVTLPKIAPASLDGTAAKTVAVNSVIGGIPVLFRIETPGGVTADTDVLMTHQVKVIQVWVNNRAIGTTSDTVSVKNVTTAFTGTIDVDKAANIETASATLIDANAQISAGTNLRVSQVDGGGSDSPALTVFVLAVRT